jgi:hypothetical protein
MTRTLTRQPPGRGTQDAGHKTHDVRLRVFIEYKHGVPADKAFQKADKAGLVIASNKQLSRVLVGSEEWETIKDALPCWTGTMTGYVRPDRTFREEAERVSSLGNDYFIVYTDPYSRKRWLFPVPEEHLDKKNAILVAEHPDYNLEMDGDSRIVRAAQVDLIERFPAKDGWYLGDSQHDIPTGDEVGSRNPSTRLLWRIAKRVGPVARGFIGGCGNWRVVDLDLRPSDAFGVAVVEREPAPRIRFEEPNGADPYRSAPRVIEDNEPETGNRTHDTRPETQDTRPGFLRRISLALGFG